MILHFYIDIFIRGPRPLAHAVNYTLLFLNKIDGVLMI